MLTSVFKRWRGVGTGTAQAEESSGAGDSAENSAVGDSQQVGNGQASLYRDCRTRSEKLTWINSEYGQFVLSRRPVLLEYQRTGYLAQILDNPHWRIRLEEWLTLPDDLSTDKVPYGLNLPKTEQEKEKERQNWLHKPMNHPPLALLFGEYFSSFTSSKEELIPLENQLQLLTEGYTILSNAIPQHLIADADASIAQHLSCCSPTELHRMGIGEDIIDILTASSAASSEKDKKFMKGGTRARLPERVANDLARDPNFLVSTTNDLPILSLFYASKVHAIVEYLLHGEQAFRDPFRTSVSGVQVAYRFGHASGAASYAPLGGLGWHLDGVGNGDYGSFSLLIGIPLNDQPEQYSGNFCVHPGSHYSLQPWLKSYVTRSEQIGVAATPTARAAPMEQREQQVATQSAKRDLHRSSLSNRPDLGEPVQVTMMAGDVVIALHKVAHRGGPNFSSVVRKMLFFRVSHKRHQSLREAALDDIWIEYEGLRGLA